MKILITGAAGFIGFHLCNTCAHLNYDIVGIDNVNSYYDVELKYARLAEIGILKNQINSTELIKSSLYPNFSFGKIDLTDLVSLEKLFRKEQFDVVINLAAQAGVRYSITNPHAYVKSNLEAFVNLLECCRNSTIKHFIYASSSSVYGANTKIPFSEDDQVDHPISLYAATKKSNELLAHTYSHLYQLPCTGLRFFTVYGPWGRPDMAPMLFADAISNKRPIKVFNYGKMERDFTYVDDVINGIINLFTCIPSLGDGTPFYQLYNIGNSKPIELLEFVKILESELGKDAIIEMLPMQPGDVVRTYADISKLAERTGYNPKINIQEGVKNFIEWYRNYMRT